MAQQYFYHSNEFKITPSIFSKVGCNDLKDRSTEFDRLTGMITTLNDVYRK